MCVWRGGGGIDFAVTGWNPVGRGALKIWGGGRGEGGSPTSKASASQLCVLWAFVSGHPRYQQKEMADEPH